MNSVYDVDFTRALPGPLKNDAKMLALGQTIAGELQENIRLSRLAVIYARLDELDETLLDILARDFHVDWYEDSYPVKAKRQVIKDSVKVHKRLGTKYAMTTALGSVFPHTEVQEWYQYGGTHHHFRIILDFTNAKAPADLFQVIRTQRFYKRLTAHLDEIIIQMSLRLEISVETTAYRYKNGMTGQYGAGTYPRRNTGGGASSAVVTVKTEGAGYIHQAPQTGTKPRRSTIAALREVEIAAEDAAQGYAHRIAMTGQYSAGTQPRRNTGGGVTSGCVEVDPESAGYAYHSPPAGTKPERNIKFIGLDNSVFADTDADAFLFTANMTGKVMAGTQPRRFADGQDNAGGLIPVITAQMFFYRSKLCGTSKTKDS